MKGSGKYWPLAALFLMPGFTWGATVGDSLAAVKSDLGGLRGSILTSRGQQVVYYNRGRVTLVGGQVKEVSIHGAEEIAFAQERLRQAREVSEKAYALRKEHRIARGIALKEGKLSDPVFLASTPELQLRFWQDFMRIYPEVDVSQELQKALLAYQVSKKLKEQDERIAELEERTRRAEERAIRAERRARHGFYSFGLQSLFSRRNHFRATASRGNGMRKSFSGDRPHHRNFTVRPIATAPVRFPAFFSASITRLPSGPMITSLPGGMIPGSVAQTRVELLEASLALNKAASR